MIRIGISVIIATFNSEATLAQVLSSIKKQKFPKKFIEIIVVDGGSTDKTRQIAKKFGTKLIPNPEVQQNYAKYLGYIKCRGRYVMFLDSDEIIENELSLKRKWDLFTKYPEIKVIITSGYKTGSKNSFVNNYINEFGDPFSFFIYRLSKSSDRFIQVMRSIYLIRQEHPHSIILEINNPMKNPILELTAGGSMFDIKFLKQNFPDTARNPELLNHAFYLINSKSPLVAIIKDDSIIHRPSNSFKNYLNKLSWRAKNNIYFQNTMGISGYSGREKFQTGVINRYKKYLFIIYCFTFIFPLVDSISLAVSRKDIRYLLHLLLCEYTALLIIYHLVSKAIGIRPPLSTYGTGKLIKFPKTVLHG